MEINLSQDSPVDKMKQRPSPNVKFSARQSKDESAAEPCANSAPKMSIDKAEGLRC
jgi:hypothetical protein